MIKVYFESGTHAELVAIFDSEDLYMACLPILEKIFTQISTPYNKVGQFSNGEAVYQKVG